MKIEKINENQIRCTLTHEDLASRKIKLSELAYGSEKAKELFRDMMIEASRECGFEADNIPLMIEAIPVAPDSIVLIITKVKNPDELDTRFSRFSTEDARPHSADASQADTLSGLDDILDLISRISNGKKNGREDNQPDSLSTPEFSDQELPFSVDEADTDLSSESDAVFRLTRFFLFRDLDTVIRAAGMTEDAAGSSSSLFKNPEDGNYYLIVRKEEADAAQFNRICNILSEYGAAVDYMNGMEEFFDEHMETIVKGHALSTLKKL